MRVLYWFRRDLRLSDNRALAEAYMSSDEITAIYVLDLDMLRERGISLDHKWVVFVVNALKELSKEVRLHVFVGRTSEVFEDLLARFRYDAVYTARPLSWSEEKLATQVREVCRKYGVSYQEILDNVLSAPFQLDPRRNFASFYEKWLKNIDASTVPSVPTRKFVDIDGASVDEFARRLGVTAVAEELLKTSWGRERLHSFDFKSYEHSRDYPHLDGTSRLSHFISLGILSIREIFNVAEERSREFVRQLAWREYYYALSVKYPWMNKLELKPYMRGIKWENDEYYIKSFVEGKTGYPIIDAGVRQLKKEGWVHNRVRLIMANFLVKDLLVDWRIGEEFFKKYLIDYDEVLNAGNWQWAASVGVDPLPVRIFNPIRQSEKYDPLCLYIKKYIPELEAHECRSLHDPTTYRVEGYYEPVVDHYEQANKFRRLMGK